MCDQQSEPWTQHQTSMSSWAPIGQDAQQPGSQHQVSSSSSWDQQYTSAAARKQQFHSAVQKQNYTPSPQGATESLNIRNILQEALNVKKVNIRIHTDSSSGKSMATRVGSSKKAKHNGTQTPFHPATGATWSCEDYQDQHSKQHCGNLHQVRRNIDALQASQRCWAHNPALLVTAATNNSFTAANELTCERVYNVQTTCAAYTRTDIQSMKPWCWQWSATSTITWTSSYYIFVYFNMIFYRYQHDCGCVWQHDCLRQHVWWKFWIQQFRLCICQHFVDNSCLDRRRHFVLNRFSTTPIPTWSTWLSWSTSQWSKSQPTWLQ